MAAAKAAGYRLDKLRSSLRDTRAATSKPAGGSPGLRRPGRRERPNAGRAGAADEGSPTMTLLETGFLGVVHWRRRAPAPDCQTEPPRGAAMRR